MHKCKYATELAKQVTITHDSKVQTITGKLQTNHSKSCINELNMHILSA